MRLKSLDILRGLDLWLLLMVGPLFHKLFSIVPPQGEVGQWLQFQFSHVAWEGFAMWDIVMPLFMFMSGVTIPFSMERYKGKADTGFYLKLLKRFCLLFFLGWIVQGNLLSFDLAGFHPFSNTLQAIAVGYLVSALLFVNFGLRGQLLMTSLLFLSYLSAFLFTGMDIGPQTNVAMLVDEAVLGSHRDGTDYTWILSSLNFSVTVMSGCFAGQIMCHKGKEASPRKALIMSAAGVALVVSGLLMSPFFPVIKRIWSSSMTLLSSGICFLLMSVLYYAVDVRGCRREFKAIQCFGMNSITAYMIGETINFSSVSSSLLYGLESLAGKFYPLVVTFGNVAILFLIIYFMYRYKVFIRI